MNVICSTREFVLAHVSVATRECDVALNLYHSSRVNTTRERALRVHHSCGGLNFEL